MIKNSLKIFLPNILIVKSLCILHDHMEKMMLIKLMILIQLQIDVMSESWVRAYQEDRELMWGSTSGQKYYKLN